MQPTQSTSEELFDGRDVPCKVKHGLILERCAQLDPGASFVLINDHDPVPLRYQFEAEFPGVFAWDYVERGPDVFRVRITKIAKQQG